MKKGKAAILSASLVLLGGAGLIFGNQVLASNALSADKQTEAPVVIPESTALNAANAAQLSNVSMKSNTQDETYMALTNENTMEDIKEASGTETVTTTTSDADASGFKEGTPLENETSSDEAKKIAVDALAEEYALTQETLDRFTVTLKYFVEHPDYPDKHVWRINLDPANMDDFSEIGCYWTYIDAETGETLQLKSAADGIG